MVELQPAPPCANDAPQYLLRSARAADVLALQRLAADAGAVLQGNYPMYGGAEFWQQRLHEAQNPASGVLVLVAEANRSVVGQIELRSEPVNFFRRHVGSVSLCVDAPWRGRGVGRALLRAALAHADDWMALIRIELHVWPDNLAARRLYAGFGFEVEGIARAYGLRQGVYADALLMSRLHPRPPARA